MRCGKDGADIRDIYKTVRVATPIQTVATAAPKPTETALPYPYEDTQGRTRHQLIINGAVVETEPPPRSA